VNPVVNAAYRMISSRKIKI